MKSIILILAFTLLASCSEEKKEEVKIKVPKDAQVQNTVKPVIIPSPVAADTKKTSEQATKNGLTVKKNEGPDLKKDKSQANTVKTPASKTTPEKTAVDPDQSDLVIMETSMGTIKLKLFRKVAPKTVENFTRLVAKSYYDGIIFHRVIDGFMIQGGDPTGTGTGGQSIWGKAFEDEFSDNLHFNKKGILAMANAGPNTNGSQFFITLVPTPHLDMHHTIFGEVVEGMDVVEAIGKVPRDTNDKPLTPVVMKKVKLG